jgi:hypothetical protein
VNVLGAIGLRAPLRKHIGSATGSCGTQCRRQLLAKAAIAASHVCGIAVRWRSILTVSEGQCPHPRRTYRRGVRLEDTAHNHAIRKHVEIVELPWVIRRLDRDCARLLRALYDLEKLVLRALCDQDFSLVRSGKIRRATVTCSHPQSHESIPVVKIKP